MLTIGNSFKRISEKNLIRSFLGGCVRSKAYARVKDDWVSICFFVSYKNIGFAAKSLNTDFLCKRVAEICHLLRNM